MAASEITCFPGKDVCNAIDRGLVARQELVGCWFSDGERFWKIVGTYEEGFVCRLGEESCEKPMTILQRLGIPLKNIDEHGVLSSATRAAAELGWRPNRG